MTSEHVLINGYPFKPYASDVLQAIDAAETSKIFYETMKTRRSIRDFSPEPVSRNVIDLILSAAVTAPSGANKQPWSFCAVEDKALKKQIRVAAEKEEFESYHGRMPETWLKDLKPLQTDWHKPFLETAPWLIVVFKQVYNQNEQGEKGTNYYVSESVGIACGILLAAIHHAGLVALTHTPSPMNFLHQLLKRPENEKPYLLIPVGYPHPDAMVPELERKRKDEMIFYY